MPLVDRMHHPDLPDYTVRVSQRAKRVQLRVMPYGEVEVVVPKRFDHRRVAAFVAEHQGWLRSQLAAVERRRRKKPELYSATPTAVPLRAIDEHWEVRYDGLHGRRLLANPHLRVVTVPETAREDCAEMLGRWLHNQARRHLTPWLRHTKRPAGAAAAVRATSA